MAHWSGRRAGDSPWLSAAPHSKSTTSMYSTVLVLVRYEIMYSYFVPRSSPSLLQTGYPGPCGNSFSYRSAPGKLSLPQQKSGGTTVRQSVQYSTLHLTGTRSDGLLRANGPGGSNTQRGAGKGQHHGPSDKWRGQGVTRVNGMREGEG